MLSKAATTYSIRIKRGASQIVAPDFDGARTQTETRETMQANQICNTQTAIQKN